MVMLKNPRPRTAPVVRGRRPANRIPGEVGIRRSLPADCFVLKVAGCSGFGIRDGEYIVVLPTDSPVHGRIVVVRGPSGMTLMGCDSGRMWSFRLKDGKPVEVPMPCGEVVIVGVVIERFGGVTEFRPSKSSEKLL